MPFDFFVDGTKPNGLVAVFRRARDLFVRFGHDQSGNHAILLSFTLPVLIGAVGLGTEVGLWYHKHRTLQGTADSAAISGALALGNYTAEAKAIAASFGFVADTNGVVVAVNRPPLAGAYQTSPAAVEVIIQEPQARLFSALFGEEPVVIRGRAVALGDYGPGCVLALNPTAKGAALTVGSADVVLQSCSLYDNSGNGTALSVEGGSHISALSVGVVGGVFGQEKITTKYGVATGISPVDDPYADRSFPPPTGCDHNGFRAPKSGTINPGVYCNGMTFDGKANVTLNPGIYYVDQGSFYVAGGTTLTGTDVTIVFTSSTGSNWPTATIQGGANVDLTSPTSGNLEGIVLFGDRNMPPSTLFRFAGGANQYFGGSIYVPSGEVEFAGGTNTKTGCTKLIADTISFIGNTNLSLDCTGFGNDAKIGTKAQLVE